MLGVQYILKGTGHNPGTADCQFGSKTDIATVAYQTEFGLDRDGVVGNHTWQSMLGDLTFSGVTDAYGFYYNIGIDGLRFYYESGLSPGYWFILDPYATDTGSNGYVVMAGYSQQDIGGWCPA